MASHLGIPTSTHVTKVPPPQPQPQSRLQPRPEEHSQLHSTTNNSHPSTTQTLRLPNLSQPQQPSTRAAQSLTVDLPYIPPRYTPGTAPRVPPPTLLPPSDSTAYIISRLFIPSQFSPSDGKPRPKTPAWLIGFRDRPAARIAVRADRVLEYVSPYELESYEYRMWEVKKEEEAMVERGEAEDPRGRMRREVKEGRRGRWMPGRPDGEWRGVAEGIGIEIERGEDKKAKKKKKRMPGPGTAAVGDEVRTPELDEMEGKDGVNDIVPLTILPVTKSGASLSTPKKRKHMAVDLDGPGSETSETEGAESTVRGSPVRRKGVTAVSLHKRVAMEAQVKFSGKGDRMMSVADIPRRQVASKPRVSPVPVPVIPGSIFLSSYRSDTKPKAKMPTTTVQKVTPVSVPTVRRPAELTMGKITETRSSVEDDDTIKARPVQQRIIPFTPIKPCGWASINDPASRPPSSTPALPVAAPPTNAPPSEVSASASEEEEEELGEDEYIVSYIATHKLHRNRLLFLVHWAGDWPPSQQRTWEPLENINLQIVLSYLNGIPDDGKRADAVGRVERWRKREEAREKRRREGKEEEDNEGMVMRAFRGERMEGGHGGDKDDDGGDEIRVTEDEVSVGLSFRLENDLWR